MKRKKVKTRSGFFCLPTLTLFPSILWYECELCGEEFRFMRQWRVRTFISTGALVACTDCVPANFTPEEVMHILADKHSDKSNEHYRITASMITSNAFTKHSLPTHAPPRRPPAPPVRPVP